MSDFVAEVAGQVSETIDGGMSNISAPAAHLLRAVVGFMDPVAKLTGVAALEAPGIKLLTRLAVPDLIALVG